MDKLKALMEERKFNKTLRNRVILDVALAALLLLVAAIVMWLFMR